MLHRGRPHLCAAIKRAYSSGDIARGPGSFSKKEHAQEEQYFRQKEKEELQEFERKMKSKQEAGKAPSGNQTKDQGQGKKILYKNTASAKGRGDMEGLRTALVGAIQDIQTELDHIADDSDSEAVTEHRQSLLERQSQLRSILEAAANVNGEERREEGEEEVELREDVTESDLRLIEERQSGKRKAHRPTYQPCTTSDDTNYVKPVMSDKITERKVSITKILEKDEAAQERMMAADLDRHVAPSRVDECGGIYPPECPKRDSDI